MEKEPINTSPIENFIKKVKGAESSKSREIRIDLQEARIICYTLGLILSRLNGNLENILLTQNKSEEELIKINIDGGKGW